MLLEQFDLFGQRSSERGEVLELSCCAIRLSSSHKTRSIYTESVLKRLTESSGLKRYVVTPFHSGIHKQNKALSESYLKLTDGFALLADMLCFLRLPNRILELFLSDIPARGSTL